MKAAKAWTLRAFDCQACGAYGIFLALSGNGQGNCPSSNSLVKTEAYLADHAPRLVMRHSVQSPPKTLRCFMESDGIVLRSF